MAQRADAASSLAAWLASAGLDADALATSFASGPARGLVVAGPDQVVRFAAGPAAALLGLTPGRPFAEAAPELAGPLSRALAGGEGEEAPLRRGETSLLARLSALGGAAGPAAALCLLEDGAARDELLRRMRAGEALAREQEAIFNSMSEGLWVSDADATVLRINPASARLNAIDPAHAVGRTMHQLVEEGVFDRSVTLEVLRTRRPVDMLQVRRGRKLVLTGTPVFDEAGQLIRVVVNERDVTEIDSLQRGLEEQEAIKDRFRDQMLEMQIEKVESRRVIAKSPAMQKALRQAIKVSAAESTVLILGESGVGKGLFADLIHKYSARAQRPLVKVNCGAIPESLVEAELFGYEKGAFTGAQAKGKAGYFEAAEGGTLFLDEIAELPLSSQVKLLRFLEDHRITRVGATASREVDVRILAATHRDLQEMVDQGRFRLDLFYRLNVIPLPIPPLRERPECILPVLRHYVDVYAARLGARRRLSRSAADALLAYRWPGNVRELMNLCERLVVMSDTEVIDATDLPPTVSAAAEAGAPPASWDDETTLEAALERTERVLLLRARQRYRSQADMARALGVNQSTVARKLKRYGIT
ncbi:MAG: sigma 54-interacting transcriptional regulator [Anaeromyxobacter sp.]|nr:sigma 54-interacting transcriptional regulator [Anaeromyxobacter sp.]MBL0276748.1 sigma 54-interacting transcriptional regulator [Anaeromyxobacter sp.]